MCGHDHFYDHARLDDGDGEPNDDVHQYIVGTAGAYPYSWSGSYGGNNGDYVVKNVYHAQSYGYVIVEVDGPDVTLTWMERDHLDLYSPGVYRPKDVWSYTVALRPVILSPGGGERLVAGSTYLVVWKTVEGAKIEDVRIEFSADGGKTWDVVATVPNTGSCEWAAPAVDSSRCLVRISDADDGRLSDTSNRAFTVFRCQTQLKGDLNGDCYVDLLDLAILAGEWLECGNPFESACGAQP
jgi:hypothetical protein